MTGFIDVWYGDLLGPEEAEDASCLPANELQQIETISNDAARRKQLASRSCLRKVLAYYLQTKCKEIPIRRTEFGKPYLTEQGYFFNLSHSAERIAIAISDIGELGLDIERIRLRKSLPALARRCFAAEELSYWDGLADDDRVRQFYRFWTAKEALVKATGRGLAQGMNQVVINPVKQDEFLLLPESVADNVHWRLIPLVVEAEYCAALVIDSRNRDLMVNLRPLGTLRCG